MMRFLLLLTFMVTQTALNAQTSSYIFVFLHKKNNAAEIAKDSLERLMKGHMANIERLANEKKLLAAGPFDGGGGIFILNTTSKDEAEKWLSTDPGVQANRWDIEILPYSPQIGSVCTVNEPYEMVTYDFLRFNEPSVKTGKALAEHRRLIKEESENGNVITLGEFQSAGHILILKGGAMAKFLESNPAVQQGILKPEKKKLWIAKGSFCEK